MNTDDSWKANQQKCIHFNGMINKHCDIGIDYATVVDKTATPFQYPCFSSDITTTECKHRQFLSDEEAQRKEIELAQEIADYFANIKANICPICKRPIVAKRQIGRCMYASPCGDRLYQGKLATTSGG